MSRSGIALAAIVLAGVIGSGQALACACCAEPGHRYDATDAVSANMRDEIAAIRLAPVAMLYNGARGTDGVEGVRGASEKPYKVSLTRSGGNFVFDVTDADGQTGRITFGMPKRLSRFEVDQRAEAKDTGQGPTLYKEWRLEGAATQTGIFARASGAGAGTGQVTARLVLQGRGNTCTAAPNFSHWNLTLVGPGSRFSLFGETKP